MADIQLLSGNDAVGWGTILGGCKAFFGYPITPQSEILEFLARELPKAGGVFLQTEDEIAAVSMVYGSSLTGTRTMTATSSPGISLMQETVSLMAYMQVPSVIVDVCRFGPGSGTAQTAQTDYRQVTRGGGHGGYRCIVLAPSSSQECCDLVQLALWLADKYRLTVYVLTDATIGQSCELVELETRDFGPLPEKDWVIRGQDARGGAPRAISQHLWDYVGYHEDMLAKYKEISENEVRCEEYRTDDADVLLVAYGYVSRMAKGAVDLAREEGLKVGLLRPITLWPFPIERLRELGSKARRVLVVEHSSGLLMEDVESHLQGKVPVHLLGIWGMHRRDGSGIIYPERIVDEVRQLEGEG
jgi:2-oxoglutarate ferredoxin oxidoreductase subunit alpha